MKKRIELHFISSYSYKMERSIITPRMLMEFSKKEWMETLGIVDFNTLAFLPQILKYKQDNKINTKIMAGINTNIKYGETYVDSILLARNNKGLRNLYHLVSKINEMERFFLTFEELKPFKEDLILGINKFDLEKSYDDIINNYTYIEISPFNSKEDNIKINDYALKHNLLVIATNKPNYLPSKESICKTCEKIIKEKVTYREVMNTPEMLETFAYLPNKEDVVINNAYTLSSLISEYKFDKEMHIECKDRDLEILKKEVYARANLLCIEDIPASFKERLNYELEIIDKYKLSTMIWTLYELVKKTFRLGYRSTLGGVLSNTLVSYVLGLSDINIMELKKERDLDKDLQEYGYYFTINVPSQIVKSLSNYLKRITHQDKLYCASSYLTAGSKIECKDTNVKKMLNGIKLDIGVIPETYYIVPTNLDIKDFTPITYKETDTKLYNICEFDDRYMCKLFPKIYFCTAGEYDMLYELKRETDSVCVKYDDTKVLENMYTTSISTNMEDYKNFGTYFVSNYYLPELVIKPKHKINSINDLINEIDSINAVSKVLKYYELNYYKVYYPEKFYEIYLAYLVNHFNLTLDDDYIKEIKKCYDNKTLDKKISAETDSGKYILLTILKRIWDLDLKGVL